MKTINGGSNWTTLSSVSSFTLYSVSFIDANTGFIATDNGIIKKTTDGGSNWADVHTEGSRFVHFINATTGIGVSNSNIFRTTDGGANWTSVFTTSGVNVFDIFFVNNNLGYITAEDGEYYKTSDGGLTWKKEIIYLDEDFGFAVGKSPVQTDLHFMESIDGLTIYAGGFKPFPYASSGEIYVSHDGGENWHMVEPVTSYDLHAAAMIDANKVLVVGKSGTIIKNVNGEEPCTSAPVITYLRPTLEVCDEADFEVFLKKYYKNTTYVWKNGSSVITSATGSNPHLTGLLPADGGNITVTVTNSCGTVTSGVMALTVYPMPTVNGGPDQTVCEGNDVTLTGSGTANTYSWEPPNAFDGVAFYPTVTTEYVVTGSTTNGCSRTDTVMVIVNTCTGLIDEVNNQLVIKIYPNPTDEKLFIETEENILNVQLFDTKGTENNLSE